MGTERFPCGAKRRNARAKAQVRRDDTARKVEAGALALNHMMENQDSEFYQIMFRLLNQNVPAFRRPLFKEMGIDPVSPKNSNAERKGKTNTTAANDTLKSERGLKSTFSA